LGKVKREMLLAECDTDTQPEPNTIVLNSQGQLAGHVLSAIRNQDSYHLLLILQTSDLDHHGLRLGDYNMPSIRLLPFTS
jgi:hypothetical protein